MHIKSPETTQDFCPQERATAGRSRRLSLKFHQYRLTDMEVGFFSFYSSSVKPQAISAYATSFPYSAQSHTFIKNVCSVFWIIYTSYKFIRV